MKATSRSLRFFHCNEFLMTYFDQFIIEIKTLEIRVDEGELDLNHYSQFDSDYESELRRLQQLAINELLKQNKNSINMHLIRINEIINRFPEFWTSYNNMTDKMTFLDVQNIISPIFIVPNRPYGRISDSFLLDLHDAVMFKEGFLNGFHNQIEDILCTNKKKIEYKNHGDLDLKPKLKIREIALKCFYDGLSITRENANEIVQSYGHKSGDKLYNEYCYFLSRANRKGKPTPYTKRRLINKITLFQNVIKLLPKDKQSMAIDELSILENMLENEFE